MKCKREECSKQAHNLEVGYCSSICNIKALEQVIGDTRGALSEAYNLGIGHGHALTSSGMANREWEQFKEELQWIK